MSDLTRLSVNVNEETAAALAEYARRAGISLTEAVRRCVAVTVHIYDEQQAGRQVITQKPNGTGRQEVVLL